MVKNQNKFLITFGYLILITTFFSINICINKAHAIKFVELIMEKDDDQVLHRPQKLTYNNKTYDSFSYTYTGQWNAKSYSRQNTIGIHDNKASILNAHFSLRFENGQELEGLCPFVIGSQECVTINIINKQKLGFTKY